MRGRVSPAASVPLTLLAVLVAAAPGSAQSWTTVSSSRQVTDEDRLDVRLTYGVGVMTLAAGDRGALYRTRLTYDEDAAEPVTDYEDGRLHLGISRYNGSVIDVKNWSSEGSFDVELTREVPLRLDMELGAVKADLDFTGLPIQSLELKTGASESNLHIDEPNPERMERAVFQVGAADFHLSGVGNLNAREVSVKAGVGSVTLELDGTWTADQSLEIEMGLGALELRIPRTLGVKLERTSLLTSIDTGGMVRRGDAYYSANWEGADHKVEVEISAAFGSVDIVWTR